MENIIFSDGKKRFSNRVADYIKYRPKYPEAIIPYMKEQMAPDSGAVVADIGSGTGILSKMLLDFGFKVYAVEPNSEMRKAAEELLAGNKSFYSISGSAENTNLWCFFWFRGFFVVIFVDFS